MSKPMRMDRFHEYLQNFADKHAVTITTSINHESACHAIEVQMRLGDKSSILGIMQAVERPYLKISGVVLLHNLGQMLRVVSQETT